MLCLALKRDGCITIQCPDGAEIVVKCYEINPARVKLGFTAPLSYKILRNELIQETPVADELQPIVNPDWVRGAQEARRTTR